MQTRPNRPALASVGMVMLMVSMSLSSGLLELNRAPWLEADTSATDVARTYAPFSQSGCLQSNATNYDSGASQSDGSCVFPLSSSFNGLEFTVGQSISSIEFGYDPTDPATHSWASASDDVSNIGFEEGDPSSLLGQDQPMDPIQFNLTWDNFTVPNTFTTDELGFFSFNNDVNDTSPDPVVNTSWLPDMLTSDRHGRTNNALVLEGGNDRLEYASSNYSDLVDYQYEYTQAMWIKPTNNAGHQLLLKNYPNQFLMIDDGEVNFRYRQDYSGQWNENTINTVLENETWYHVAFTGVYFTANKTFFIQAYINGSLEQSFTHSAPNANVQGFTNGGSDFSWGGDSGGGSDRAFNGTLDDHYSFNEQYNASQIQDLMNIGRVNWSISPDLPEGLIFDSFAGRISGTPTRQSAAQTYEVSANSTSGTNHTREITLGVISLQNHLPVDGATCTVSPALPAGLTLNGTTCNINGTPTSVSAAASYSVSAQIDGETFVGTLTFAVNWGVVASEPTTQSPRATAITPLTFNWTLWSSGVLNSTTDVYTTGDSGHYNSLVVDSNDHVHIVYYRDDNANLMYATNRTGSWQTSTIESSNNVGKYCNLAVDSSNGLHVSYQYNSGNALRYAYKSATSSTWSTTTVDNTGGKYTSIAIDSNDKPHIAYRDSGGDVGYAEKTGYSWSSGKLQSAGDVASTSITVDSNNHLHLAYYDAFDKNMFHLSNISGAWVRTTLEDIGTNTGGTSLDIAIDPTTDEPGISYFDMDATSLKYTYYTGNSWVASTVENSADYGRWNSIAYDSVGNVHISHERNSVDDLYYSSDKTGSWVTTAVDTSGSVGTHTSIDVDSNDDIHIAYRYNTGTDTRHATVQGLTTLTVPRADVSGATCSISPSLPSGLTLTQGTCSISGTPTTAGNNVTYNLTATSASGNEQFGEFNLWVTQIAPSIDYSGSPFTITEGVEISTITPSNTGDSAFWSVSPSLPAGLGLSSSGEISGTPTLQVSAATYTITATNNGGSDTTTISLAVLGALRLHLDPTNTSSYSGSGTNLDDLSDYNNDGTIATAGPTWDEDFTRFSYDGACTGSSPNLVCDEIEISDSTSLRPGGGAWSVAIWVNASTHQGSVIIGAFDDGGASTDVGWAIRMRASGAIYANVGTTSNNSAAWTTEASINTDRWYHVVMVANPNNNIKLYVDGQNVGNGSLSSSGALRNVSNNVFIGAYNGGEYNQPFDGQIGSVMAYADALNATFINQIYNASKGVYSNATSLSHSQSSPTLLIGQAYSFPISVANGELTTSYSLTGTLPSGMNFETSNGTVWGTPTAAMTTTSYTVTANNSAGTYSTSISLTSQHVAPYDAVYSPENMTLERGAAMTTNTPGVSGGTVTSWAISPSLPSGMAFSASTGAISGTPTGLQTTAVTYIVWANNSGGSSVAYVNITINAAAPNALGYSPENMTLEKDTAMTLNLPSVSGGTITSWEISPSLPSGLTWGASDGNISGTPTALQTTTVTYTVWANNSGGSTSTQLNITINDVAPTNITYANSNIILVIGSSVNISAPTFDGGNVTNWSITPALPSGLELNTTTGAITGTPTALQITPLVYNLTGVNSGGFGYSTFSMGVTAEAPKNLNYSPSDIVITVNMTMNPVLAGFTGGTPTSWWISGSGPSGIIFGLSNGTIWGTPTAITNGSLNFMIWANNSGGSAATNITLSVVDELPAFSYSPENLTLTKGQSSSDLPLNATLTGSGTITSWAISPALPSGLTFGTSNGTIWGTPTSSISQTNFTIYANNSGGSSSFVLNLGVNAQAPGPFEYNPENNTLTKGNSVHLAPTFINQATGNGSAWRVADINSGSTGSDPGEGMSIVVGNVLYFGADDGSNGIELWAYNTSNTTTWLVEDIRPGSSSSNPGSNMMQVINGVLYFNAVDGSTGQELWKHDPSTGTTSRVYDLNSGSSGSSIGLRMSMVVGDVLYFSANDGSTGHELWAYNTSNSSNPWQVMDINSGSGSSDPGTYLENVVGDTLYFSALGVTSVGASNGIELWAHNTSNLTTWEVANINYWYQQGYPGMYLDIVVGDTLYFSATDGTDGHELWAHNTSNESTWQVADIANGATDSKPGDSMAILIGDTIYFDADDGNTGIELWAHDTSNHSTWQVADINSGASDGDVGEYISVSIGNTLLFSAEDGTNGKELWAHDTLNGTTWMTSDMGLNTIPGYRMSIVAGDTLFFDDGGSEPYAYSTSNATTWRIADINSGSSASYPGWYMSALIGDTLYFDAEDGSTGKELWAFAINGSDLRTNTGGAVTSYEINASLPNGLSFNTNTGVISGTPTGIVSQTAYMVWANNSGGSSEAYLNITVVDELPTLSYSPENLTLTKGQSSTDLPLNATLSGAGAITSWAISPALPSGLTFGTSNGTIWGTPTILQIDPVMYTIWANNSGGSVEVNVNITINDEAPDIEYNPDWFVLTNNTAMSPTATPTNSGGAIPSGIIAEPSQVGSQYSEGRYNSIAVDSNGAAHVVYFGNYHSQTLYYATNANGSWVTTMLKNQYGTTNGASIVIDSNDTIHISYSHRASQYSTGNNLYYSTCSSSCSSASSWSGGLVVGGGYYNNIAIDTNGTLHISHWTGSSLQHSTCSSSCSTASSWTTTSVTSVTQLWGISMTTDSNNSIHILYSEGHPTRDLNYATCSSGCTSSSSWSTVELNASSTSTRIGDQSIAVDSNNGIHITYQVDTNLTYAACSSSCTSASSWTNTTVDTDTDDSYARGEIAIDSNDHLYISYAKGSSNAASKLTYATCSSSCTSASSWTNTTFDTNGGNQRSMALDSNDRVHISYYSSITDKSLRYLAVEPSSIVYAYSISPALPAGLSLEISTGEISGTPTELSTNTTYTITVRNSGGTTTRTITIVVNDEVPTIAYSPNDLTITNNTASSDLPLSPTVTGSGEFTSWAISPSVPSGLAFDTSNGTLSGTPTELLTRSMFTITATNTGGTATAYINITIVDEVPTIAYSPNDLDLTNNTASSDLPLSPTVTGSGEFVSWAISPSVPSGLAFDTSNGTLSGTPTELLTRSMFTITATNTGGTATAYINITIVDEVPTIAYSPNDLDLTNNTASSDLPLSPTVTGSGEITSWEINASLPSGLTFETSNGTIWGTPTELWTQRAYMVWANNTGGSAVAYLNITVVDELPTLSYSPENLTLTNNTGSSDLPLVPTTMGSGEITSWEINASLPSGLTFGTSNGTIYGTPTELWTQTAYMVWANNSGGFAVAYLNITVNDQVPTNVSYGNPGYELVLVNNTNPNDWILPPTVEGHGTIVSWAINASLPSGVDFNTSNGRFSGKPTELWQRTPYTIWANNSGGSAIAYLNITVNDQVPTVSYSPNPIVLVVNLTSSALPLEPVLSGSGAVTSWELVGTLPAGLSFGSSNGTFWGTPTSLLHPSVNYTVWANNSGGSSFTVLAISVVDAAPSSLSYSPSGQDVPLNTTMTSMQATVTGGGPITNWTIHPLFLPLGVQFNENNGQMSGTPTELWTNTTYTVFANNSGGSVNATFWLTVTLEAPNITYAMVNLSLVSNLTQVSYNGTNTGGELIYGTTSISGYSDTFCAVSEEGELWCWGDNNDKIVNVSASTSANLAPTKIPLPTGRFATSVKVGYEFACALLDNGSVACWGDAGTLGRGGSAALSQWDGDDYITPQLIAGIGSFRPAVTLDAGFAHACVTFLTGVPQCWGTNTWDNLGIPGSGTKALPTNITVVPANRTVLDLSLGTTHVCALLDNASVMCWGENQYGGLGDNSTTDREDPVWPNVWGRSVRTLEAGNRHTCVGFTSGGASCWGHNYQGKLGDNSTTNRLVPVNVTGIATDTVFVSFELTYTNTCGRTADGRTLCWGKYTGQNPGSSLIPVEVTFASNGTSTELAGDGDTMCAVLLNGTVACWGWGSQRNFGVITSPLSSNSPVYGVLETTTRSSPGGWMLDGVLPDGLQFSPSNGTLWGTPSEVNASWVNFTVTAYNNAGTSSYSFSIQVLDQLPSFSYNPTTLNLVKGLASSQLPLVPNMTGDGDITSWAISPSLPNGLQLGSTNGTVYGLPSGLLNTTEFTVWANNSGGSSSTTFNLTVVDQVPTMAYSPSNLTFVRDETSSQLPLEATVVGAGEFLTWTVSPPLSSGLSLNPSNGTLSGIPSTNASLTSYTITATNSGGNRTFVLNITVLEPLAVLSYASLNLTRNLTMTPLSPAQSGGVPAQWGLSPSLPAGLSFANGLFWGTPTVNMTTTTYTVWANNSGGSASTTVDITVLEPVGALSYTPENLTLYRNITMSPLSPTYTGGSVENWSVDPALPNGLVFTNGVITGTPQFNATTAVEYTVWANHSGGSVSASFNITVLEAAVLVVYSPSEVNLVRNQTVLDLVPSLSGGTPDSWAIEPSLPEGLLFANGRIFGTATVNLTRTTYSVWANTTGGSNVVQLNLTVVEPLVELTFAPDEVVLVRNQSMTAITAGFNGGAVESWTVDPALPAGLRFLNGVLSGTPEVNMTRTSYTIWANNSGGSVSVMINLTVFEPAVDFVYQPNTLLLTRNQSMATVDPIFLNDAVAESWGISPALPSGMSFDNGTVYGRPTVNLTATSFTVWANNSGGSTTGSLLITVLEPVATIGYAPDNLTVTRGQENLSMVPLLGGGAVATWSISPDLPAGLRFENGTLSGVAQAQAPLAMYVVTAENSGGLALAYLNLTVLEPVAVLSINASFVETRGKAPVNATVNNTGGSVANWDISPALPSGVRLLNGLIYGSARVNMTQTTFTVWANNSGGSASVNFTLEILEPRANITYGQSSVELVTGITNTRILPLVSGGVPQYWAVEPALPVGLRLEAGVILGIALNSSEATTYTVWANNSGGSATTSITLAVNWPIHFARYPVPRLVLDVNETLPAQYPVISFTSVQNLGWSIEPALPEGFTFVDGVVSGVPVNASDETNYTVTVIGQMAPLQLHFTLEVRDIEVDEVPRLENNNTMEEKFVVPQKEVFDTSFNMYYICPPILIFIMLIGAMGINNYLKRSGYIELEGEEPGFDDDIAQ